MKPILSGIARRYRLDIEADGEAPKLGSFVLSPACKDFQALGVVDGDGMLGEFDGAISVTEGADPDKVVDEGWHDVARVGGII